MIGLLRSIAMPQLATVKLGLCLGALAGSAAAGGYVEAKIKNAEIGALRLAEARRENDDLNASLAAETRVAQADAAISGRYFSAVENELTATNAIVKEIPTHVSAKTNHRFPLPYGVVRVYDAAILGADPDSLPLPAGRADDAPAPTDASFLAENAAQNYAACRANAQQLSALEGWITAARAP